jgi:RNA-directed DNA polymerase
MHLGGAKPQKIQQLELPYSGRGEAPRGMRSEEALTAGHGDERLGASGLMEAVCEPRNLKAALRRVRQNKGSPGIDEMTVEELPTHLQKRWVEIRAALLAGSYQPQGIRRQEIPKSGGGVRELGIPTVLDRFIQQAMLQVLQPIFDPTFSEHSHGFRPRRNAHGAVCEAQRYVEAGRSWVVDIDLEKFFDRVNHDVLMGRLAKMIGDKRMLGLMRRYLEAGVMVNGVVMDRDEGTPQGGPLSPLLANVLLDEADKELERRGHAFVRYADDCNVYVRSKRAGERVMKAMRRMYGKLRLRINEEKSGVALARKRGFLGYSFWVAAGGAIKRRVAGKALKAMKNRVREITKRTRGRSVRQVVADLRRYLLGWKEYFKLAETPRVFRGLDDWIRHRLRAIYLKHWRRGVTVFRELRARGMSATVAARVASGTRRWWRNSQMALHIALPNRYFAELGLPQLGA